MNPQCSDIPCPMPKHPSMSCKRFKEYLGIQHLQKTSGSFLKYGSPRRTPKYDGPNETDPQKDILNFGKP